MTNIEKVSELVSEFLKKVLDVKEVKVIRIIKVGDGWQSEAEVYEDSSFIKSIGLPTRVKDRNIYVVKLNNGLEVESYKRNGQFSETG
jgi:hypothetical protein